MSEDDEAPLSAVGVAYDFIHETGDAWTRDDLMAVLARAGFPLDDHAELDDILEAVFERIEFEKTLSAAIDMFLRQNTFGNLHQAAEQMDCTVEEVVNFIAAQANLFGKSH